MAGIAGRRLVVTDDVLELLGEPAKAIGRLLQRRRPAPHET